MEDQVDHFLHRQHPLKLFEVRDDGIIDGKRYYSGVIECDLCRQPISISSGSSLYACILHYVFMHKTCGQLKKFFNHPLHPFHPLSCISQYQYFVLSCDFCDRQLIHGYYYRCEPCKFTVCPNCASAEIARNEAAIALKQESVSKFKNEGHNHPQHTLIFHSKPTAFLCNACQTEKKDLFYHCDHCDDFLIHKSCATLTPTIDRPHYHRHPLSLVFSLPEKFYTYKYPCDVCNKRIMQTDWTYHCSNCRYFFHIKCLPNPDQLPSTQRLGANDVEEEEKANDSDILHFPMSHPFTDPLKLLFHSKNANTTIAAARGGDDEGVEINHWSHDHPLFLLTGKNSMPIDDFGSSSSSSDPITVCDCCVRPLSSAPYYSCKHDGCSFTLHKYCVELSRTLQQHPLHPDHSFHLKNIQSSGFTCYACDKICNAFLYECETCSFRIDVNCAILPKLIKHEFHKQHRLVQHIGRYWDQCITCEETFDYIGYYCDACNFRLDLHCALRSPRSLPHRYCKGGHEVPLMCPPIEDHLRNL